MKEPIVSVLALTYNHVEYVDDMLKGFLKQETDFEVEYIIHDDASTDGTQEVLREFEEKHPDFLHVIYEDVNQWSKGVKIFRDILLPMAKGKYIAFCEGDDFWVDKNKLHKQKDFLDKNEECVCVAHNALIWDCKNDILRAQDNYNTSRYLEARDIIDRRFPSIATASKMHRREVLNLEPMFLDCGEVGDMPTDFFVFTKGKIYYMDEIMSIYRYESNGSWSQRVNNNIKKLIKWRGITLDFLSNYNEYTNHMYTNYIEVYMTRGVQGIIKKMTEDNIPQEEFVRWIQELKTENKRYIQHYDEIVRVINLMVYKKSDELKKYLENNKNSIYIYGAGLYGNVMGEFLKENDIDFEGFVVKNTSENPQQLLDKNVISLKEFSNIKDQSLLIVGVGSIFWEEMYNDLNKYHIDKYINPLKMKFINTNC